MYTYDTGLIRLRYTVTDTYRVVKSAGYTLNSSENEFKFMALQSWRVNSMNSYSQCRAVPADEGPMQADFFRHQADIWQAVAG